MTTYTANGSSVQTQTSSGTYTVNPDCSLKLSFNRNGANGGATGAFVPPTVFSGLLSQTGTAGMSGETTGLLTVQPVTGETLTGLVVAQ
jgi:hypothetical protein